LNAGAGKTYTDSKGFILLVLAGLCAFGIDFFVLKAYASGLPVTIGGPVIIGGSIAIATIVGFFLGDSVTAQKIIGISLVAIGAVVLARISA
jgi:multidrug transporter EmrE-like cation transporter